MIKVLYKFGIIINNNNKQEVTNVISLVKNVEVLPSVLILTLSSSDIDYS